MTVKKSRECIAWLNAIVDTFNQFVDDWGDEMDDMGVRAAKKAKNSLESMMGQCQSLMAKIDPQLPAVRGPRKPARKGHAYGVAKHPPISARTPLEMRIADSPIYCEHANECPAVCGCPGYCYCRQNTCKNRPINNCDELR